LVQRDEVRMLDLPATRHLFHHKLGIHEHVDVGGAQLRRLLKARDQPAVLGHIVGGTADGLLALGQHRGAVRGPHHRSVSGRTRVATRSTIGLDDHLH